MKQKTIKVKYSYTREDRPPDRPRYYSGLSDEHGTPINVHNTIIGQLLCLRSRDELEKAKISIVLRVA